MPAMTRRDEVREVEQRVGAKDPVCGMGVDPTRAAARREHAGETYFFCSTRCAEKFDAAPQSYLSERPQPARSRPDDVIYTCPMHPEIEQVGPGDCPICGMALEPKTMSAEDEGPSAELRDMTRRFWVSAALALPLLVWVMGDHLLGLDLGHAIPRQLAHWIQLAVRDAGGALGRLADLQALLGLVPEDEPEHVDADRHRRRRGVSLQRGRNPGSRHLRGRVPRP